MFLLIKLFQTYYKALYYLDLVPRPGGYDHRVPGPGTQMKNGTRLCPNSNNYDLHSCSI